MLTNSGENKLHGLLEKSDSNTLESFIATLNCIWDRDEEAFSTFLIKSFSMRDELAKLGLSTGSTILDSIAKILFQRKKDAELDVLIESSSQMSVATGSWVFLACAAKRSPQETYDRFSYLLQPHAPKGTRKTFVMTFEMIAGKLQDPEREDDWNKYQQIDMQWDPRWLDLAVEADELVLASLLARPGHQNCIRYFQTRLANNSSKRSSDTISCIKGLSAAGEKESALQELVKLLKKIMAQSKRYWATLQAKEVFDSMTEHDLRELQHLLERGNEKNILEVLHEYQEEKNT